MAKSDKETETVGASNELPPSKLTGILIGVAALTTVVGFATFFSAWLKASIEPGKATLQIAAKQLDLGHFIIASDLAKQAVLPEDATPDLPVLREYLIGAGIASEAFLEPDAKTRRGALRTAIPHLQTAALDWPANRPDEGDRLFGLALFQTGDFESAIPPLSRVVDRNPTVREELVPILAQCYLHGTKDDAALGLSAIDKIDRTLSLSPSNDAEIECLRAQCYLKIGNYDRARGILDELEQRLSTMMFGENSTMAMLASKVSLLLAAADVSQAIERFGKNPPANAEPPPELPELLTPAMQRLAMLRREASPEIANQASLWEGRAMGCYGKTIEALNLFSAVRQQQPFEGANIAAGIEEIEILAAAGSGEETLQTVRYLLREIGGEPNFDATVVDLASFRSRLISAIGVLRSKDRFKHCIEIAGVLPSLIPAADALYEEALTHLKNADSIVMAARQAGGILDPESSALAKKKYRESGDAFAQAARLRFDTKKYNETLWQAIDAYQNGGQFELCVELLAEYLRYEDRSMQPRALLALGKARLATGAADKSLLALEECMVEFPRDPLRYDARLYAAFAHVEAARFDAAKQLLNENLTDGGLTPESSVWRDSLYTLGELLFRQANETHLRWALAAPNEDASQPQATIELKQAQPILEEAIIELGEAITRFWPDRRAKHAAYLKARAHKLAAVWPKLESESVDSLDAAKRQLRQQADEHLTAALAGFVDLRRELASREEEQTLSSEQQATLRNCYIAEADTLFELGKFEEAAEAFRAVSLRYLYEPPALEALLGQSKCLQQLNRPREARLVIRQALVVLGRIPSEADGQFTETTRYDRKRWQALLAWLDAGPMPEDSDA